MVGMVEGMVTYYLWTLGILLTRVPVLNNLGICLIDKTEQKNYDDKDIWV